MFFILFLTNLPVIIAVNIVRAQGAAECSIPWLIAEAAGSHSVNLTLVTVNYLTKWTGITVFTAGTSEKIEKF